MSERWAKVLRRSTGAGITLAILGLAMAVFYIKMYSIYAGSAYDSQNESVLWRAPLTLGFAGFGFTFILESCLAIVRGTKPNDTQAVSETNSLRIVR